MKIVFLDKDLESLLQGKESRKYKKYPRDTKFIQRLMRVFYDLRDAPSTDNLRQYSYLHYEKLRGADRSSVRVMNGRVERLIFREVDDGIEIEMLEMNTDHYGDR